MATKKYILQVDETDKKRAEEVFKSLGMSFAMGVNVYLKTVGNQKRIPFKISAGEPNGNYLRQAFKEAQEQSIKNKTDKITMEEINEEIALYKKELRDGK